MSRAEEGFSLIEALVALLILAVGAAGLVRAAEAHVDSIRGLEQRATAQWVAENRLAELRVGAPASADVMEMLGQRWRVTTTAKANEDPDLRDVEIAVAPEKGGGPTVRLKGFVDAAVVGP